jgi:hypothetical protein
MGAGAAIIGGIGAATQVIGAVKSFSDAKKQKDLKDEADREAAQAMIEVENLLQTNYAESVQVPLEPYELAMQGNAAVQSQNIQALRESGDRALIGGVGKAMAAGADANEAQRLQMQKDLMNRDIIVAAENDRIRNQQVGVELGTVKGAQTAAAQAEVRAMQLNAQGFQGLAGAASTGLDAMGLYEGFGLGQGDGTSMAPTAGSGQQAGVNQNGFVVPNGIEMPIAWDESLGGGFKMGTSIGTWGGVGANSGNYWDGIYKSTK